MRFMNAKFAGTCVTCKQPFPVGAEIAWSPETGASHRRQCPTAVAPTAAEVEAYVQDHNAAKSTATEKMVPGVYEVNDTVYVVKMRKDKTGLYAMKMVEVGGGVIRATESGDRVTAIEFEYEYGIVLGFTSKVLTLADRMPVERAKQLVTLYGRCIACNRKLKAAKSVEQGIGPVCIGYFGPVIEEVEATTVDGRNVVVAA